MGTYQNIINPEVADYLVKYNQPLNEDFKAFRKESEEQNVPIILPDAETLICNLLRLKKPQRILEIGTAVGYSAAVFASVCEAAVTTIEVKEEMAQKARKNIERFGLSERITVLCGDGEEIIHSLSETFDFVFIDAAKSHYRRFFDAAASHCTDDALIVCDNVLFKARTVSDAYDPQKKYKTNIRKMREFVDYLMNLEDADTSLAAVGDGLTVTILKRK